ncbi:DNA primase [Desulfuromonas versatilis]|uniref:DNA primase n=1 Tax=Desulfuromonas versatilis TaxID=2802975 RepID=A0ABN6E2V8_9BACT|nr:DNA primase [Desulfuromonas versatilis]BCR06494.1 DNA primase [Desulfuromonas versatilis]
MSGRIPEEKIQEIRDRVDIVDVVSSYLPLKRSGANHQGLCPFHAEKTPSFNVNAPRQIFHCFGCGEGGNVFSFLMRMEGLSFPEAVRRLGERVGIEVEEERLSPAEEKRREERERLLRISEVACEFYHQLLLEAPEGAPGRRYLRDRGYGGEAARSHRLGFAPARWEALAEHLAQKGFDPEWARQLGLIRPGKEGRGDYDLFRNRLLFPISDPSGRVVAFGGRVLDDSLPKYINSPESPIYHKSRVLYGLSLAREEMRKTDEVIVVEGYFDQLALHRAGFCNAVATCGTALTEEHAELLKRYAKRVLLLFDQDSAGQKATFRAMEALLPGGLSVAVVGLDPGEDPDSFIGKHGAETFRERLEAARPVFEVFMENILAAQGENIEGKARAAEQVLEQLRLLPGDIERSLYLKALAARTGLDEALLRQKIPRRQQQPARPPEPPPGHPAAQPAPPRQQGGPARPREAPPQAGGSKAEQWLLLMLLRDPEVRGRVAAEGPEAFFSNGDVLAIAREAVAYAGDEERIGEILHRESLSEEQKALLSGILIKDDAAFAEDLERVFDGCRRAVAKERLQQQVRELDARLRTAEQAGNGQLHAALLGERMELNRKLKSGNY